jgi:hypothetical protein
MIHVLHMFVLASLMAVFFALLVGKPRRRLRTGLVIWAGLFGGGLLLGLVMYPFS